MSETVKTSGQVFTAICLLFILNILAYAQPTEKSVEEAKIFYELTEMTPNALARGESGKAKSYAETLLKQAENFRDDWNYGNAVHVGNLVLGHIALDSGDLDEAKRFLLEAGKTPGSPQLDSFGPNMLLSEDLLEKEEYEIVLQYFELCALFWKRQNGRLDEWKKMVANREKPDFETNLLYGMSNLSDARRNLNRN